MVSKLHFWCERIVPPSLPAAAVECVAAIDEGNGSVAAPAAIAMEAETRDAKAAWGQVYDVCMRKYNHHSNQQKQQLGTHYSNVSEQELARGEQRRER